jgi:aquaporin Z
MNKLIVEFIGTFFLVLTIGLSVIGGAGSFAPFAIAAGLMVMIYAGGHVSGAHYNPAVTIAVLLRGRATPKEVGPYWLAQIVGAVLAALAVKALLPEQAAKVAAMTIDTPRALLAEFLFTFALAYVILNVATAKGTASNSFYGVAIALTVLTGAITVGGISGGVFNPAVAIGIRMMGLAAWSNLWVYLVANFAGAVVAAMVFRAVNPDDR